MFDIAKLNKSSFRGIPFYTDDVDLSGGQRLTDHSFINGGTKTESNGVNNDIFKVKAYIGGDDYLTQKDALREAFKDITSGIYIDRFNGTHEVYVDTWSIKESRKRLGKADVDVSFKLAENQVVEDFKIVYSVDVRKKATANLANNFNNKIGDKLRDEIIGDITKFWNTVLDTVKFLEDERDRIQNIKSNIGRTISNIKTTILSIDSLVSEIIDIWSSFDDVLDTSLFGEDEQKSFTNTLREILEDSSSKTFENEAQQIANQQSQTYINTVVAGLTQTSINNLENVEFETGDDLGSVKDDILSIFEILEKDIEIDNTKPIDEIILKQDLLDKYHFARREFIQFYTQKYSGLQDLKDNVIVATTDVLTLTMERYNDISRANEVLVNNDIVNPLFINGNIKLLDR